MNSSSTRFPAASRLLDAAAFDATFKRGTRGGDKYFTVFALASEGSRARLGIAVSKRNIRLAVERNRIKRLVRESFRNSSIRDLALDIVVLPRSTTVEATPERLRKALASRWDSLRTFLTYHKPSPTQAD